MASFSTKLTWKWMKRGLPILLGATAGYAYYHFIGCVSGACPITNNPWSSIGYGALLGFLLTPRTDKKNVEKVED